MYFVLIDDTRSPRPTVSIRRPLIWAAVAAVVALLVTLQIVAMHQNFPGPLHGLISDYVATPKSASVPWAGLVLALVGLGTRQRIVVLGAAIGIDLAFTVGRLIAGGTLTYGNGPMIVLTGLALIAGLRWSGMQRLNALRSVSLGALLILATKVGDAWLQITTTAGPRVLDPYIQTVDRAFGDPSWLMGRFVEALGPVGNGLLHWVYIELPVAAMVVAVYQLRNVVRDGWPKHFLFITFLVLGLVGPLVYLFFPVVGPTFAFGTDGNGMQLGDYWPNFVPPFEQHPAAIGFDNFTPRNCMPSMHTAWAVAIFIHSRRGPRWLRYGGTFWLLCTLTATLGFGYHYGADLVAGAVLSLTVESAFRDPERGWGWFRIRLVAAGATLLASLLLAYRFLAVQIGGNPEIAGPGILLLLAGFAVAFYATFFAAPGSMLAAWGRVSSRAVNSRAASMRAMPRSAQ